MIVTHDESVVDCSRCGFNVQNPKPKPKL